MRFERIGGSRLDTDSEVGGLDQTTWELMWVEKQPCERAFQLDTKVYLTCLEFRRVIERKH